MGDRDEERERFIERIGTLTGRTTYRVPVGGRATGNVLTDQDVAAAIAMGRRRDKEGLPDFTDVGPELVYSLYTQRRDDKPRVTMRIEEGVMRVLHMKEKHYRVGKAVNAAYESFVFGHRCIPPGEIPTRAWQDLYDLSLAVTTALFNRALDRAERAFRRAA